jgi:hypothetical protein
VPARVVPGFRRRDWIVRTAATAVASAMG